MEVERLQREYPVKVRYAPYLLDPSMPPEGRPRTPRTTAETPKSEIELRAEAGGFVMRRGRAFTPSSRPALEAVEYAYEAGQHSDALHRALFKAVFDDFEDIGDPDVVVRIAGEHGVDREGLHEALASGRYRERLDEQIEWARKVGVSGVPTYIFDYKYAIPGAQEYNVLQSVMDRLGYPPPGGGDDAARDPEWAI